MKRVIMNSAQINHVLLQKLQFKQSIKQNLHFLSCIGELVLDDKGMINDE